MQYYNSWVGSKLIFPLMEGTSITITELSCPILLLQPIDLSVMLLLGGGAEDLQEQNKGQIKGLQ